MFTYFTIGSASLTTPIDLRLEEHTQALAPLPSLTTKVRLIRPQTADDGNEPEFVVHFVILSILASFIDQKLF